MKTALPFYLRHRFDELLGWMINNYHSFREENRVKIWKATVIQYGRKNAPRRS